MDWKRPMQELSCVLEEFFARKTRIFEEVAAKTTESLREGGKILVFGNGGSAAQAQHFAAELVNKFLKERPPIKAVSLTTDTSALTSIANDSSFDTVFSRQVEALGERGDVALGLSTSGSSQNVIEAVTTGREKGLLTVAFTGEGGGKMAALPHYILDVPSTSTPRIQEVHLFLLHLLAQELEERLS